MRHRVVGYQCEGEDERIHHLVAHTTRELRTTLRRYRLRMGRWHPIMPGDHLFACEWYWCGEPRIEPTAMAHIRNRGGHFVGRVYRYGGRVVPRSRRNRATVRRWAAETRKQIRRFLAESFEGNSVGKTRPMVFNFAEMPMANRDGLITPQNYVSRDTRHRRPSLVRTMPNGQTWITDDSGRTSVMVHTLPKK